MSSNHVDNTTIPSKWTTTSDDYQERIGKCTMYGTTRIVQHVGFAAPYREDSYCLDVGTGGGSMVIKLREKAPAGCKILATDIAPGMLKQVDALKLPNVTTQIEDAVTLSGLQDNTFSHVLSSYAIQFTPNPPETVRQMYRVLKPGGTVGIAIWGDYTGPQDIHDRACRLVKPDYAAVWPSAPGAWSGRDDHRKQMEAAGFKDVEIDLCHMPFHCTSGKDFCDYWFDTSNPIPGKLLGAAKDQGIDIQELRKVAVKLVDEEFNNGKDVFFTGVLGWGRK